MKKQDITALNPENQSLVNKADKLLTQYLLRKDLYDIAMDSNNEEEAEKLDLLCDESFDKLYDVLNELPIEESSRLERYLL